jgi:catechol 2,3-dioxygenase-like lactoylglutathione lyase family enzyme
MNITSLELITMDLQKRYDFYSNILDLSVNFSSTKLEK